MASDVLTDIPGRSGAIMLVTKIVTVVMQERLQGDRALLPTPLNLIFPDYTLLPVNFALDPVLKYVA
jgi:hypothetical protein